MIPERENEALMRLHMCAMNMCEVCKYQNEEAKKCRARASENASILLEALNKQDEPQTKEPTWEQVKEYCNKRCLDIVDSAMRKKWYKDESQTIGELKQERDSIGRTVVEKMTALADKIESELQAEELIREAPTITADRPEWIPCSERLPDDKHEECLVNVVLEDAPHKVIISNFVAYVYERGWINAWMPLPEPYEGKGE